MPKKLQLHIPEPCHEDWDKMTPCERGRFCSSCQKQVIDFTGMSDQQLAQFFKKPILGLTKEGSVCGRFTQDQLERDIIIPRKRIPWLKYFFQFTLPAFLVSMKATAQGNIRVRDITECTVTKTMGLPIVQKDEIEKGEKQFKISGRVVDESDMPVPYASVVSKGTSIGTVCDSAGIFELKVSDTGKTQELLFSAVGYLSAEIRLRDIAGNNNIIAVLKLAPELEEVVVACGPVMGALNVETENAITVIAGGVFVSREFSRKRDTIQTPSSSENLKVYPNPVRRPQPVKFQIDGVKEQVIWVRVFSIDGKAIAEQKFTVAKGANVFEIPTGSRWSAGVYSVVVTGAGGKVISQSQILLQ